MIIILRRRKDLADDGNGSGTFSKWFIVTPRQFMRYAVEPITEEAAQDIIDNFFDAANTTEWEYTYNIVPI